MADSSINVISLRIVKAGPDYTYPVEVYGRVIVRDEVDYKCVHLFDCEKNNAQLINSEVYICPLLNIICLVDSTFIIVTKSG